MVFAINALLNEHSIITRKFKLDRIPLSVLLHTVFIKIIAFVVGKQYSELSILNNVLIYTVDFEITEIKDEAVDTFIEQVGKAYKNKIGYAADFYVVEIGDGPRKIEA